MASISVSPESHPIKFSPRFSISPLLEPLKFHSLSSQISFFLQKKSNIRYSRCSFVPLVRAESFDVFASSIKPGGVVETDKLPSIVRKRTMDAVDACGLRVTIGDVVSKAGINLNEAQKALQALAADANGFLEVTDEGDVLYVFPKDYRSKLAAKSLKVKFEPLVEKAKCKAEYIVRVSFGTALIASIVIVFTTIIAILILKSDGDSCDSGGGGSSDTGSKSFNFYLSPSDSFGYQGSNNYRQGKVTTDNDGMNFIESVFSFVFGDGDPNQGIEEERWKLIGQYIGSNGGVTTAEELAPYLDVVTTQQMNDHSYILPVLLRFDGKPQVDDEGNILYCFPSLQRTASSLKSGVKENLGGRWAGSMGQVEMMFREKQWQFSKASISKRAMVIGLGALNILGVTILDILLKQMTVKPGGLITFVSILFPLLQIYAGSFIVIPLVRLVFILKTNAEIVKRNRAREQCAQALKLPDLCLRRKLQGAQDIANRTFIGEDRIVYTTEKDMVQQDYEAKEWDQRLREKDESE